jgi:hypothetical protein
MFQESQRDKEEAKFCKSARNLSANKKSDDINSVQMAKQIPAEPQKTLRSASMGTKETPQGFLKTIESKFLKTPLEYGESKVNRWSKT